MNMPTALFSIMHLYLWICVKVYYGHTLYIMPGICHNFIITVNLLVASLSNPEFWYISLSLMMAHQAETRLAIDVLVSVNIICYWLVLLRLSLFRRTVNLCQQFQASHSYYTSGLWKIYEWYVFSSNIYLTLSIINSRFTLTTFIWDFVHGSHNTLTGLL